MHQRSCVTPEEAVQQLGWLVVAAPADGSAFGLRVVWRLFQGAHRDEQVVTLDNVREPQYLRCPFAFDGRMQLLQWAAEVTLLWRGTRWTHMLESAPLFPAVPVWRALVYDRQAEPYTRAEVADDSGRIHEQLPWQLFSQEPATMKVQNLSTPHGIRFVDTYHLRLRAGEPLAAFVATTIHSPVARAAVIVFPTHSPTQLYFNGSLIATQPDTDPRHDELFPSFFRPRRTTRVQLQAGSNTLLLATEPPRGGQWWAWFASAVLSIPTAP